MLSHYAEATGLGAIAIGEKSKSLGDVSTVVGTDASAYGDASAVQGWNAAAYGGRSAAFGANAVVASAQPIDQADYNNLDDEEKKEYAARSVSYNPDTNEYTYEYYKITEDSYGTAIGAHARAVGGYATSIGTVAKADADLATSIGAFSVANADRALAIGSQAQATSDRALSLGYGSKADETAAIAIGDEAQSTSDSGIAIGSKADVHLASPGGIAIGAGSKIKQGASFGTALGLFATANENMPGGVALGAMSTVDRGARVTGYDPRTGAASADDSETWQSTFGAVSIGGYYKNDDLDMDMIITRQLTGLAAGSEDTDAVNVAQLKAVNELAQAGAVHYYSVNDTGQQNMGNYNNDGATGHYALAAGTNAKAAGLRSVAMGGSAESGGDYTVSIGYMAGKLTTDADTTKENMNTFLGGLAGAESKGKANLGLGFQTAQGLRGDYNTSVGSQNAARYLQGSNNSSFGQAANYETIGNYNTAIGYRAGFETKGNRNVSLGNDAGRKVVGDSNISIGDEAGYEAGYEVEADNTISIGTKAKASASGAIAMGSNARAAHNGLVAIGSRAGNNTTDMVDSVLVGDSSGKDGTGKYTTYVGQNTGAGVKGEINTAIGKSAMYHASGKQNTASGAYAGLLTEGDHNVASGYYAGVSIKGSNNVSIGSQANNYYDSDNSDDKTTISNVVAVGFQSYTWADNASALGYMAKVGKGAGGGVALGYMAAVDEDIQEGVALGSRANADEGASTISGYDISEGGASDDTSPTWRGTTGAVSVGDVGAGVTRRITDVAAGSADTDVVNVAQLKKVAEVAGNANQGFSIAANSSAAGADTAIKPGETLTIQGTGTGDFTAYDSNNIQTQVSADNTITIGLKKDLNLSSVTTGNTVMNNTGIIINNADPDKTVSLTAGGLNNGGNTITNVAAGVNATDAVNLSQLNAVAGEAGKHSTVAAGTNVKVTAAFNATGGTEYTINAASSPVQYTNTNDAAGGNAPNPDQFIPTDQVTLVGTNQSATNPSGNAVTINNVAPAVLSETSLQAVNGSQLYAVGSSTAHALGGTSTFNTTTGQVVAGLTVGGNDYTNVQDALDNITLATGAHVGHWGWLEDDYWSNRYWYGKRHKLGHRCPWQHRHLYRGQQYCYYPKR